MAEKAKNSFIERRMYGRRPVNARVKLMHTAIGQIEGETRDISDSGVFVAISPVPNLPIGGHIKMYMLDSAAPNLAFNMKIVRTTDEGLGMMFIDFELEGERYTIEMLRKQLQDK